MKPFQYSESGKGTDYWIKRLSRQSMPMAGSVIAELNKLSGDEETDLNHLAELILRDPTLTSHALRIANSVQYNAGGAPVSTVSRAIVMIGLKGMRALCVSLLVIDSLLKSDARDRMYELMAQGFHAATQARALVSLKDPEQAEETFIAALLINLGEMAFWASNDPFAQNQNLVSNAPADRTLAIEEYMGTSFRKITRGLARQWKLGQTLEAALLDKPTDSPQVNAVKLAQKVSSAALDGWDSPGMKLVLEEVSRYTYLDPAESLSNLKHQAEIALEVANQYGAGNVCRMIPSKHQSYTLSKPEVQPAGRVMKSDPQLQLNILRELTSTAAEKRNVNTVFQMVIEGIHRGIGLERVAIAFAQKSRVTAKYSLGVGAESWRDIFDFDIGPYADNVFAHAFEVGGMLWVNERFFAKHKSIGHKDTARVLGGADCLIFVFEVSGKRPGLIYADRADFGGKITQDHADSFHHFASQAQFNLQAISGGRKRS